MRFEKLAAMLLTDLALNAILLTFPTCSLYATVPSHFLSKKIWTNYSYSQYYYNSTSGHYMYWDAERSTYLPAPTGAEAESSNDAQDESGKKDGKERKDSKEKVKIAKKIAKVSL